MLITGTASMKAKFFVLCHSRRIKLAGSIKNKQKLHDKVTISHHNNQYECTNLKHSLAQKNSRYGIKNFLFVANLL